MKLLMGESIVTILKHFCRHLDKTVYSICKEFLWLLPKPLHHIIIQHEWMVQRCECHKKISAG